MNEIAKALQWFANNATTEQRERALIEDDKLNMMRYIIMEYILKENIINH